jgi:hypothetical protein
MRPVPHPLIVRSRAFRLGVALLSGALALGAVQSWPRLQDWLYDYHEIAAEIAGPRLAAPGWGGLRAVPGTPAAGAAAPTETDDGS